MMKQLNVYRKLTFVPSSKIQSHWKLFLKFYIFVADSTYLLKNFTKPSQRLNIQNYYQTTIDQIYWEQFRIVIKLLHILNTQMFLNVNNATNMNNICMMKDLVYISHIYSISINPEFRNIQLQPKKKIKS